MDRRKQKDRRAANERILTDKTERRKNTGRRKKGVGVTEIYIDDDTFNLVFKAYISHKKISK